MQGAIPKRDCPFPLSTEECKTVEEWNGIGGQMELARQRQAVVKRPRGTGAQKKAVGRGTAKMRAAAGKTLEDNSEQIAKSLLDSTLGGNASSARLLFALAEGQIDCEDEVVVRRLCRLADKLAAEPEWDAESIKDAAEMGFSLREGEG
jgi:hypothetical protein